jgi:uncharacterized Tic20 family protein
VAFANIIIFSNSQGLTQSEKVSLYASVYLYALIIPFISVLGVFLSFYLKHKQQALFKQLNKIVPENLNTTKVNWWILGGSFVFVVFTLTIGSLKVPFAQEIVFMLDLCPLSFF